MNNLGMFYKPVQGFAGSVGHIFAELFDYDVDGNLIYYGVTNKHMSAGMDANAVWYIAKYYYDTSNGVTQVSYWPTAVAWTGRTGLAWVEL